jgi:glycosyltransferase involved in cell wall biosynthesis
VSDGWAGSVCLVLASSTGGVGQHVLSLVRGLSAGGAVVTVCGPAATEEHFRFTEAGRTIRFVPIEIPANPTPGDGRAVVALRRVLAGPIDLVHAHGLRAGLVAALARPRQPLVVTWHNAVITGGVRGGAARLAERLVARAAAVTIGASDDLVSRAALLGARDARLVPVAAPDLKPARRGAPAVRAELGIGRGEPLVLSVGRLHPQKRYEVLIDAAAGWRGLDPAPAVVIAGSGPAYLQLAARISAKRAPVVLLGHRNDVADLLAAATVAVVTSDWEARQLFAQEALRAGVALVSTAVGGIPDLVGDAAVLVPAGDVAAVEAAVRELLDDPDRRAELVRRGRERAAAWPDEAQTLGRVRGVYAELVPARAGTQAGAGEPMDGPSPDRPPVERER